MKLGKISGIVGAGLLAASCNMQKPATQRALEHAAKYLKGHEVAVAKGKVLNFHIHDYVDNSQDIFYWDSLLSVNREKQYREVGKQYIKDSIANKNQRKPIFKMPIEPDINKGTKGRLDSIKLEVSKYYTGKEFIDLETNAPNNGVMVKFGTIDNQITHYYGELAIKGAERKGFLDGANAERNNIKK